MPAGQYIRKVRPIIYLPDYPRISLVELTKDQFSVIDIEDAAEVSKYNWQASWNPQLRGFYAGRFITTPEGKRTSQSLHQFIMGKVEGFSIDHINRCTLDNRRSNLRHATDTVQQLNKGMMRNNTSGFTNVCLEEGRWRVRKRIFGKTVHLGAFSSLEEAVRVEMANRHHLPPKYPQPAEEN